jgi:hypothetical protein
MSTQKFRISFVVDKELVPTVTALVVDRVSSLHIEEVERERASARVRRGNGKVRDFRWARASFKAIAQWMLKHGDNAEHHYTDMAKALPSVGVGVGSISPIASGMVQDSLITRVNAGTYKLTEKGKALADK